ncbi:MAG: neutral zinc metallopeptidase [Brachymonas sp.]
MKWEGQRQSDNIEDRRSGGAGRAAGKLGIGTIVLGLVASYFLGINPMQAIQLVGGVQNKISPATQAQGQVPDSNTQDAQTAFVRTVVADTEDVWGKLFAAQSARYQPPTLVLYSGATPTACGQGQAAMGPFYCPGDHKMYLDFEFFRTLEQQLQSPGEFAKAYVIAHEVGHHIQKLEGSSDKMDAMRGKVSETEYNKLSVRLELQADCYAGVWAHHANVDRQILESGDIESALNAAAQIGDDALQKKAQGYAVPDSFTHGSSAQRVQWFKAGFASGDMGSCNTFAAQSL